MAQRFRGESSNKVDAKGRVSIPAAFRRTIEQGDPTWREGLRPQLVVVYGNPANACLECYTMEAVAEVDRKIARMPRGSPKRRFLEWMFNGKSVEVEVDPDGRMVVPPVAREAIGLGETATFMGAGDTFQIWKPETYATDVVGRAKDWLTSLGEGVDPLTFLPDDEG